MLGQLLIVGYFLGALFNTDKVWMVLAVLTVMVLVASWIGLRTVKPQRRDLYILAVVSVMIGGGTTLILVTQIVLKLSPWYRPQYLIPLAGMIFAGNMNCISLAAERYFDELKQGAGPVSARETAFRTALIPVTNSLFAVGLVSLPGMMTGQILSGVDPLIAVRYQIMVMAMIFGADGIASASFLYLVSRRPHERNVKGVIIWTIYILICFEMAKTCAQARAGAVQTGLDGCFPRPFCVPLPTSDHGQFNRMGTFVSI